MTSKIQKEWKTEIEGMRDFYDQLLEFYKEKKYEVDFSCNTDGRIGGTLFEFKLLFKNINEHKEQIKRYLRAYNSSGINAPKYTYLISLNQHKYIKINNEDGTEIREAKWDHISDFEIEEDELMGWIDEYSIASWNNKYCEMVKNATKEQVKKEFISPQILKIKPFDWEKQLELEKSDRSDNNWLTFNMNLLGNSMLRKMLGAYFTPNKYVKLATEMVREAIKKVPEGNDYIILDRCAGTGNLEKFLNEEELKHCVLNTYDYTEWTTLKGIYDGRVKMIIPPTSAGRNEQGLLENGDALSENFFNYEPLKNIIENEKITVILLENPPFVEATSETTRSKTSFKTKDIWLRQKMIDFVKTNNINVNRSAKYQNDIANTFIFSGFKWYLRQKTDSYILFSPIKYWKWQHLIDKKFVNGYLCNRKEFNATNDAAVSLIHWQNEDVENDKLIFKIERSDSDSIEEVPVNKIFTNINVLLDKNKESNDYDAIIISSQGTPDFKNGNLINYEINKHVYFYKYKMEYIYNYLPLWVANEYKPAEFYEKEVIMKSGDGGNQYLKDDEFLKSCFVYSLFSMRNQCISNDQIANQFTISQTKKTSADKIWNTFKNDKKLDKTELALESQWKIILNEIEKTSEYNKDWNYGLYQIDKEINVKIDSNVTTKKGDVVKIPKYYKLNEAISKLKELLKEYYKDYIVDKLFKYQLLK